MRQPNYSVSPVSSPCSLCPLSASHIPTSKKINVIHTERTVATEMIKKIGVSLTLGVTVWAADAQTTLPVNGTRSPDKTTYAITNARLFIEPGRVEEAGTLLYREGKIVQAGKGVAVPTDAVVTDAHGMFVYPGFVELVSDYGLKPAQTAARPGSAYESTRAGAYAWNDALKTDQRAAGYFEPDAERAAEWRKNGFGTVVSLRRDGVLRGTAALVTTGDGPAQTELLVADIVSGISFQKGSSKQSYPSSLTGAIALLRQAFLDAKWYENQGKDKERNLSLEALNQYKHLTYLFEGGNKYDLLRMQALATEYGFKFISKGSGDEYQRLANIKQAGLRIALPLNFPAAPDVNDPYDALRVPIADLKHWENAPFNARFLHEAGISFAITSDGLKDKDKDQFWERLRLLAKNGLPKQTLLAALTTVPAGWLGTNMPLGTLKPGAPANFFLATGDVFDDSAAVTDHWVQGKKYSVREVPDADVRGQFAIQIPGQAQLTVTVSGYYHAPKAEFLWGTRKGKGTFTVNGKRLLMSIRGTDSTDVYRLQGTVNPTGWSGTGLDVKGNRFAWKAEKRAPYQATYKDSVPHDAPGRIWYPQTAYGFEELPGPKTYLLQNGTVWTGEAEGILTETDVLIVNGKIAKIGKGLSAAGAETVDCKGLHITAGIIDEHSHIALTRGVNEGGSSNSAEVRMADVINADDINLYRHLAGGVTTVQQLHGSANAIGGQSSIIKLRWGKDPEGLKLENAPGFIKFALGENVKQSNWGEGWRYPQTRLGVEQFFLDQFLKAKQYRQERKAKGDAVRKDLRMETLLEILHGKRYITCHSYVQSEINMLMKVADSVGFKVNTFTHILEGYKVADKMKAHGANASTFSDWWAYKMEVNEAIPYNAALLTGVGVNTAINSDDAEMARRLNQEAAKTVKYGGLSKEEAWKLVTLNPAKMLHIDARTGSLKAGKDADVVIWNAEPLSIYARAEKTFVDGTLYFDRTRDAQLRQRMEAERTRIIAKMLQDPAVKAGKAAKPTEKKQHLYHCDDIEEE